MPRPGPLQELPLDQFLPPNPNLPSANKSRPNKRPLSPGGPNLYSPAKRRILNEEGIFSPERTIKSPTSARGTPARFADIFGGPSSPVRKLDFGAPKHHVKDADAPSMSALDETPAPPPSSSNRLAPSPEFKSDVRSPWSGDDEMVDYFSMPTRSSHSRSSAAPTLVREIPPPADPQSAHYPGFRVHCDTHIFPTPLDDGLESLSLMDSDKEGHKENLAPRRKPRKVATAPNADLKSQLFSPDTKRREMAKLCRAKSTPMTPKRLLDDDRQESGDSPTPRRSGVGLAQALTSSTPRTMNRERRQMRRALQDEVDDADQDGSGEV